MPVLLLVLAAAATRPAVDGQIRVDPFFSSDRAVDSGALIEAQIGARAGDMRVQLRLAPFEIVGRGGTSARLGGFMLIGFESEDLELSAGLGRVVPVGEGHLPSDVDTATFAWLFRMGALEGTSFSFLGAHAIPAGPVFATADALLQVALVRDSWLLLRAGAFFGGYELVEAGLRTRVISHPGGGGTFVRWAMGLHAVDDGSFACTGEFCFSGKARTLSPSFSIGLEWR